MSEPEWAIDEADLARIQKTLGERIEVEVSPIDGRPTERELRRIAHDIGRELEGKEHTAYVVTPKALGGHERVIVIRREYDYRKFAPVMIRFEWMGNIMLEPYVEDAKQ
jgi:hypothetical protein